jgi:hypothetical protein
VDACAHSPTHTQVCEAACLADANCQAWTYVVRGTPELSGDCCLKSTVPCPVAGLNKQTYASGAKTAQQLPACDSGKVSECTVQFKPNATATAYTVGVSCGQTTDTLTLLKQETSLSIRLFIDVTFAEVYFQEGRIAMTIVPTLSDPVPLALVSTAAVKIQSVETFPMKGIWASPEAVRKAPRVYQ